MYQGVDVFCSSYIVFLLKGVLYIFHLDVHSYTHFKQPHCFAFIQQTDNCEVCVYRHQWLTDHTGGSRLFSHYNGCRNRTWSNGFSMHQDHVPLGSRQKSMEAKSWIWSGHYRNKVSTTPYVLCNTYIEVLCYCWYISLVRWTLICTIKHIQTAIAILLGY